MIIKQTRGNAVSGIVFNGIKYYKKPTGYYSCIQTKRSIDKERYLHRAIWKFYNGDIPKGYHVHHKDENKDNNDISNLELLSASEHSKLHNGNGKKIDWWHSEKGKRANKKGIRMAKFWHHSEDGYLWHSEHQKITCQKHIIKEICNECGKEFNTYDDEKRHQINCRKCRDKLLKRKLRLENPEKYKPKVRCILTCKNMKDF